METKKITIIIVLILILLIPLTLLIFKNDEPKHNKQITYQNITAEEAKQALDQDKNIILLDVRTKEEYNEKHIPNSILIPLDELEQKITNEITNKQTKIFIYCQSGARATTASELLINLGYENIYNLGGIINWKYETE